MILKAVSDLDLKKREIDVLAYISTKEFDKVKLAYFISSTVNTVNNCLSKLTRMGFITKKRELNPQLLVDFQNINLNIKLLAKETTIS